MTASAVKGAIITALELSPVTLAASGVIGGKVVQYRETIEAATTSIDETGDIIHMLAVPSKLKVSSLKILADDLDSHSTPTLAYDVGVYTPAGVVVDADHFASAIIVGQSADKVGTEVAFESGAGYDISEIKKELWDALGAASDPGGNYYISITITTTAATPVAGTITMICSGVLS